jgi:transcriptional regulator with XRE-family HTH domain
MMAEERPWGEALTILRVIRGWTPEDLAAASGFSLRSVQGYERGERPTAEPRHLVQALGFPPSLLDRAAEFVERSRAALAATAGLDAEMRRQVRLAAVAAQLGQWFEDGARAGLRSAVQPGASGAGVSPGSGVPPSERPWAEVLTILRVIRGVTQRELEAAGFKRGSISRLERGRLSPKPERLWGLVEAMGFPLELLDRTLAFIDFARAAMASAPMRNEVSDALEAQIVELAAAEGRAMEGFARDRLGRLTLAVQVLLERREAPALWEGLRASPAEQWRQQVRQRPELQTAGFCELLCEESIRAAGDSARRARLLAQLAVDVAERVRGEEGWRRRTMGYAWAHLGSAVRVGNDLPAADAVVQRAAELWQAGAGADPALLNEARVLGLRATLLRDQRRLPEALALFDRAIEVDRWGESSALLMGKAKVFEKLGQFEEAIGLLRQAGSQVDPKREPRRFLIVRELVVLNLCHLGRHGQAQLLLGEVRALAQRLGNRLDLLKIDWLQGIIVAGLGQHEEAIPILERVRGTLVEDDLAYEAALVTLELAEIHASLGHTAEVKRLARESTPFFQAQEVHHEAQAALELFRQAAEREAITAESIHRFVVYLYRAQDDPQLQFEEAA